MTNEYGQARYAQLEEEVELFKEMGISPIKRLTGILNSVREAQLELKSYLYDHPFADQKEEIYFFKYIKPRFYACHIYALEVYTIETGKPIEDDLILKNYYEQELKYLNRFFSQNQFLYQYYKLDVADMDALLFVRGVKRSSLLVSESPDIDPEFSTACDNLFSRFIAYELVREFLINSLNMPGTTDVVFRQSKKGRELNWTGNKSDLVELAYGIYDTLQINNGDVDIADIIDWFEQSLHLSLGRYYQCFSDIKSRKSVSKTHFLDHMREMLILHIDEGDAFKPRKPKRVSGSKSKR